MIEKLGHYSLTDPASVYDEEALTALELAGRTAAKVNECVDKINDVEKSTTAQIKKLSDSVDDMVATEVQKNIENGTFDKAIDDYAGDLFDRLDEAISGDAVTELEITDMRTDFNGVTHSSAGEAIRSADRQLNKRADYAAIGLDLIPVTWAQGTFDASSMSPSASSTRVYSKNVISAGRGSVRLGIGTGFKVMVREYKQSGSTYTLTRESEWLTGEKVYKFAAATTCFKLLVGKTSEASVTPSEVVVVVSMKTLFAENTEKITERVKGLLAKSAVEVVEPDNSASTGAADCANTKRWFISTIYPANTFIKSISLYTSKTREPVTVEVWKKNGDVLTLANKVSAYGIAGQIVDILLGFYYDTECMISVANPDACVRIDNAVDGALTYAHGDLTSTTLNLSGASVFSDYLLCASVYTDRYTQNDKNPTVITVGDGMDFAEIQEALDSITDDGTYVINVYPRATPYSRFSMIRKLTATYPWTGAPVRNVSIIGLDREHCIVKDTSGDYNTPPAELLCNGLIKGLRFIATHTAQNSGAAKGSYAAHIDAEPLNNTGYRMVIEDCDFISEQAPAVGVGLHQYANLIFKRCTFENNGSPSYTVGSSYKNLVNYGALFVHTSTKNNVKGQRITLDSCRLFAPNADRALWLGDGGGTNPDAVIAGYYNVIGGEIVNDGITVGDHSTSEMIVEEAVEMITFYYMGVAYRARKGITWAEYLESDDSQFAFRCDGGFVLTNETPEQILYDSTNQENVADTYEIYANALYIPYVGYGDNTDSGDDTTMITFYYAGKSYTCPEGMTWAEYLESSYKHSDFDAFRCDGGFVCYDDDSTHVIYDSTNGENVADGYEIGANNEYVPYEGWSSNLSFTYNGTSYNFEEGMTWDQFIKSDYNTLGLYTMPETNNYVYDDLDKKVYDSVEEYCVSYADTIYERAYTGVE